MDDVLIGGEDKTHKDSSIMYYRVLVEFQYYSLKFIYFKDWIFSHSNQSFS